MSKQKIWALTIHQPFAAAIAHSTKRIENRTWKPPNYLAGCYLAIHASKRVITDPGVMRFVFRPQPIAMELWQQTGAVIAVAKYMGFVEASDDYWYVKDHYGWVLDEVVSIEPVPCRGQQGLWTLPAAVYEQVRENYAAAKSLVLA